jgi:hypothetical protein
MAGLDRGFVAFRVTDGARTRDIEDHNRNWLSPKS